MKRAILTFVVAVGAVGFLPVVSEATLITSLPTGTIVPMPALNSFGAGPQAFGPGITWDSTNATTQGGSVFGYTGGYGFDVNGSWTGALGPMAGLNDSFDAYGVTDTMTFSFSTPVYGVGGFLNYVPGSTSAIIAVYDAGHNLIESAALSFLTGGAANSGMFLGFSESTPISYFELSNNYIGITDLTTAVPEPTSGVLIALGLLGSALIRRGRSR